ncbi:MULTISPECIES: K(+)-transporting ATPase subunit F [unclassified Rhodococcus (in: high G+C Gram-positive bacteria)]|jgi:K+-transporting ATPase KdpF subunit|nr:MULTISPECIES: K(+)-transporting ATPase subunit F [unclassified Rhodococcus (in: high G+C Gram-positive bacteria)]MBY6685885.1 K(+)-transporting ATPase subunit F [Rhodococcus sp. BP-288]MBY6694567.1 K(+)-transporting ATPase subunit F [Rhodococcus sp. BP-188]MBY6699449.1 K(+)-transporting ATPase subunit F [Rhodococcus sp. BP-285]MBY6703057.1 K(+)-transporting ATPase subunit F [Rhodococcus sp. BP-283]MBY6705728.1 K(+)-transporting ATPase subunit F [Rhodococcus sp. BP-241]
MTAAGIESVMLIVVSAALAVYLLIALLDPERF